MNPTPDAADLAMRRFLQGDEGAFAELYAALSPRLARFLARHLSDEAAIEDLVQQTMLNIHRARARFEPDAPVMPWATAIARRLLMDRARHERRRHARAHVDLDPCLGDDRACPDRWLDARELAGRLDARLRSLPPQQRTAYELLQRDGLTLAEAAQSLGTTVTAVKLRAHRAYESLRQAAQAA